MQFKTKCFLLASIVSLALLQACKKNKDVSADPNPPGGTTSSTDKIKDTTIADARDIYLWYSQIPSTFNAQSYADPSKIMEAIRQYSNEPGFSTPVDKWSFGMKQSDWDNVSNGVSADFGMNVFFMQEGDLRVKSVESGSPASWMENHEDQWKHKHYNSQCKFHFQCSLEQPEWKFHFSKT
jgi:carboxyl-terminal processing protease